MELGDSVLTAPIEHGCSWGLANRECAACERVRASERVLAFVKQWESAGVYGPAVYTLGRIEGDYELTVADLRLLATT
jgi:hypothetical protein